MNLKSIFILLFLSGKLFAHYVTNSDSAYFRKHHISEISAVGEYGFTASIKYDLEGRTIEIDDSDFVSVNKIYFDSLGRELWAITLMRNNGYYDTAAITTDMYYDKISRLISFRKMEKDHLHQEDWVMLSVYKNDTLYHYSIDTDGKSFIQDMIVNDVDTSENGYKWNCWVYQTNNNKLALEWCYVKEYDCNWQLKHQYSLASPANTPPGKIITAEDLGLWSKFDEYYFPHGRKILHQHSEYEFAYWPSDRFNEYQSDADEYFFPMNQYWTGIYVDAKKIAQRKSTTILYYSK